jgi:hypothetical protein
LQLFLCARARLESLLFTFDFATPDFTFLLHSLACLDFILLVLNHASLGSLMLLHLFA